MPQDKYLDIARKYAPVFVQKVNNEWQVADQIASVDYAGHITRVAENPKKLCDLTAEEEEGLKLDAKAYYSVCETTTHYFLIYAVYHIVDWWKREPTINPYHLIRDSLDEHAHDMEGALIVVTKGEEDSLDAVITVSHLDFYLYSEPRIPTGVSRESELFNERNLRIVNFNRQSVDGNIWLDQTTERVKLYIQAQGHGIRGDHKKWGGGDEMWYYKPLEEDRDPGPRGTDMPFRVVTYELEDIFAEGGLWEYRHHTKVFMQKESGQWGFVYRDEEDENSELQGGAAHPPWSWNDHNDPSPMGELATDPARFATRYAQGWGPVSTQYIYNPYQAIIPPQNSSEDDA